MADRVRGSSIGAWVLISILDSIAGIMSKIAKIILVVILVIMFWLMVKPEPDRIIHNKCVDNPWTTGIKDCWK